MKPISSIISLNYLFKKEYIRIFEEIRLFFSDVASASLCLELICQRNVELFFFFSSKLVNCYTIMTEPEMVRLYRLRQNLLQHLQYKVGILQTLVIDF